MLQEIRPVLWIEMCPPQIHMLSPTYNVTVFEDGVFKNVIKVKWGNRVRH